MKHQLLDDLTQFCDKLKLGYSTRSYADGSINLYVSIPPNRPQFNEEEQALILHWNCGKDLEYRMLSERCWEPLPYSSLVAPNWKDLFDGTCEVRAMNPEPQFTPEQQAIIDVILDDIKTIKQILNK